MKRLKICILPKLNDCGGDPNKKWFVYFTYRDPANYKMKRFRVFEGFTQHKTKKAKYAHAESQISKYRLMLQNGWNPFENVDKPIHKDKTIRHKKISKAFKPLKGRCNTFSHYSKLFLPYVEGTMAEKTYRNYINKLRIFDLWLNKYGMDKNDISTVTPDTVQRFFLFLINEKQLAKITISKYQQILNRFFDWSVRERYLQISPMQNLPSTKRVNDKTPRPINESDFDLLISKIEETDKQLWLAVQLEYYCFLRPGKEIRLSRISWFDVIRGTIYIPKTVTKNHQNKIVIVPNQFREYLIEEWKLHQYPYDYFLIGKDGKPGQKHLGINNLRIRFNAIRDSLNLSPTYKLYSFKYNGNIRCANAGFSALDRQRQNGHSSMYTQESYLKHNVDFDSKELRQNFPPLKR